MSKTTILYRDVAPGAAEAATVTSTDATENSSVANLRNENPTKRLASLETNRWTLDSGFDIAAETDTVPFESEAISGADTTLTPTTITVNFGQRFSSLGITLVFDGDAGDYGDSVAVTWYYGATVLASGTFEPDGITYFCHKQVEGYDKIVITFSSTALPCRRIHLRQIVFGILRTFDMTETRSARITNQIDLISAELPTSTFDWELDSAGSLEFMFQLKQPIEIYNDDHLLGVYYIAKNSRVAKTVYDLNCQDAFGVLDDDPFGGGVYTNKSAKELVREIIGSAFDVDDDGVTDTTLTGFLQSSSKRAALQQVFFAWGVIGATDGTSKVRIFEPDNTPIVISEDDTYTGSVIDTAAVVTEVKVKAHTYAASSTGSIEINGTKYAATDTVYTVTNPNVSSSDKQNIIEIVDATLISPAIGQATAQRVYDHYMRRNTARGKIVWHGLKLGECITIPSAWGVSSTGNVSRMDITLSNTVAASCEVIANN